MPTLERQWAGIPGARDARSLAARQLARLGPQDWIVLGYSLALVATATALGPTLTTATRLQVYALFATTACSIALVRGGVVTQPVLGPLIYRVGVYGTIQASYFVLGEVLPHVSARPYDAELYALDMRVFGFEPALVFDALVSPATTEWFAFFYYSYFLLLAAHALPGLFLVRNQRVVGELGLGLIAVFCVGQTFYMIVPAYGPYRALAESFTNPLPQGFFMSAVMRAVKTGGALLDVFPSLHTAGPLYVALFSFRHRHRKPYRYTWPLVAFFVANIVVSTMFLRWHYLIDVIAGAALAVSAAALVPRINDRDLRRRARQRLGESWPPFPWSIDRDELIEADGVAPGVTRPS